MSLKSCRNVIDGSFRACIRDARQVDYLLDRDPFEAVLWPRGKKPKPDPFTEPERDTIIAAFAKKSPFYVPFIHTLFWTGARPSELLALTWGDVDLRFGFMMIDKSRYIEEEGAPKTEGSNRQLKLLPSVVEDLKSLKPVHVTEKSYVFLNKEGNLLKFHTWRGGIWYRILRGLEIRPRRPYCTRHTFISAGLSNGVNISGLPNIAALQLRRSSGIMANTSRAMQPSSWQHWLEP